MENAANQILELALSYSVARCLHVIAEIGVADALNDQPCTAAELAASTGVDAAALARALRLLSAYDIFEARDDGYVHTPASLLLRTNHRQSMRSFVRWIGAPIDWQSFELLESSIRTGVSAAEQVTHGGVWAYLAQHPETKRIFDEAMTGKAHGQIAGIISNYDFAPFSTIADIGGGRGHLLHAVLSAAPHAIGVLFDLPDAVERAASSASPRFKLQAGDFFKDPLPVCDAYLMMQVIHDWSDDEAGQILRAIRQAAPGHAKLLLIEAIIPEDSKPSWIKMLDIFMLALHTGRERTRHEFEKMLAAAGFRLDRVVGVGLGTSLLEASIIKSGRLSAPISGSC
jgi:hypothetical protein